MSLRQIMGFGVAVALLAAAAVGVLHAVDASQEVAVLVVLVIAAGAGTVIGVFGEPAEEDRDEPRPGATPHPRPS